MREHPVKSRGDKSWDFYGSRDPYFGVLTSSIYHQANLTSEARRDFFETGTNHMLEVVDSIKAHVDSSFEPARGLDFGCGVGRLAIPMASLCKSIVAVDVSESMLEEAKENFRIQGITNAELAVSDDHLSLIPGKFDFINSYLVFQHIPRKRGVAIFARLLSLLNDGGVGVFHFTYHRDSSSLHRLIYWVRKSLPLANRLVNLLLRRPSRQPMMEMNEYQLNDVLRALQEAKCDLSHIDFSIHSGLYVSVLGVMIFCQKKEAKTWTSRAE